MKYFNIPMFLSVFVMYAVQRGFVVFSKSGMMPDFFGQSLQIFFVTVALSVLLLGPLLDNMDSKFILLGSLLLGILGIMFAPINPWLYGITFGIAMGAVKLIPFSTPLRIEMYDTSALRIAFQASAKNFGGAFFILFLGIILKEFGLERACWLLSVCLTIVFVICLIKLSPIDKVDGWKWLVFKEVAKKKIFWGLMIYFFLMSGIYWLAAKSLYPALTNSGLDSKTALLHIGISFIFAGLFRWITAYAGDQLNRFAMMITGTIGMWFCYLGMMKFPLACLYAFAWFSAIHTPNYWAMVREEFKPEYINTVMALAYVSMYLGAGVMYGKWY